jgi:hypothetical protein
MKPHIAHLNTAGIDAIGIEFYEPILIVAEK